MGQKYLSHRLVVAKRSGGRGKEGRTRSLGLAYTIIYRIWIDNKVLLHSIGNYIQYPMINHNEKEYIFITESFCCTV